MVVEVTQRGAGPVALVADHPAGKAGAVTPSKCSTKSWRPPGHGVIEADGVAVAVAVAVGDGLGGIPVMVMRPLF